MNRHWLAVLLLVAAGGAACRSAAAASPDGTWIIAGKVAVETFGCDGLLCGKIVWLRDPALRTPAMCNRTIVWGLRPAGSDQWTGGWFFDPEDSTTYNVDAGLDASGALTARIYRGFSIFGRTEVLTRIQSGSRPGWCSGGISG